MTKPRGAPDDQEASATGHLHDVQPNVAGIHQKLSAASMMDSPRAENLLKIAF